MLKHYKGTPEHNSWVAMKQRCYYKGYRRYDRYGGRGIKVCDSWLESFENFYNDMGPKPSPKHSLDRIDTNGNYCPENCRWADQKTQTQNMGIRSDNTSGVKGISRKKDTGKWQVCIGAGKSKKTIYLGVFSDWFDAVCARKSAENTYWTK